MSLLIQSRYHPALGGHAPDDLREAFEEAVDAVSSWKHGEPEPIIEVRGRCLPVSGVCGLLWNCTDTMPSPLAYSVGSLDPDYRGRSYATAARSLKSVIKED
jgi:hypothetical protein